MHTIRTIYIACGLLSACLMPVGAQAPKETAVADFSPNPEDAKLVRGKAYVERAELKAEAMVISGNLPTSCHQLRIVVPKTPDAVGTYVVDVYSVVDPRTICAQMLLPFMATVPLTDQQAHGKLSVDGKPLGLAAR